MVTNPFMLHVNMLDLKLMEEIKRHAVIVILTEENSQLETAVFLKHAGHLFFKRATQVTCKDSFANVNPIGEFF